MNTNLKEIYQSYNDLVKAVRQNISAKLVNTSNTCRKKVHIYLVDSEALVLGLWKEPKDGTIMIEFDGGEENWDNIPLKDQLQILENLTNKNIKKEIYNTYDLASKYLVCSCSPFQAIANALGLYRKNSDIRQFFKKYM